MNRKFKTVFERYDVDYGKVKIESRYDKRKNLIFKIRVNKKDIIIPNFMIVYAKENLKEVKNEKIS